MKEELLSETIRQKIRFASVRKLSSGFCRKMQAYRKVCLCSLLFALAFFTFASTVSAQPAISRGEQLLSITGDECMRRALLAFQEEGYNATWQGANLYLGQKEIHSAYIMCNAAPDGKMWVNIVVASNAGDGNVPGAERVKLQGRMDKSGGGDSGGTLKGEWDIKCCNDELGWTLSITQQEGNSFSGSFSSGYGGGVVTNGQLRDNTIEFDRSEGGWKQHWSAQLVNDSGRLRMINGVWTGDWLNLYPGRNNWHAEKK